LRCSLVKASIVAIFCIAAMACNSPSSSSGANDTPDTNKTPKQDKVIQAGPSGESAPYTPHPLTLFDKLYDQGACHRDAIGETNGNPIAPKFSLDYFKDPSNQIMQEISGKIIDMESRWRVEVFVSFQGQDDLPPLSQHREKFFSGKNVYVDLDKNTGRVVGDSFYTFCVEDGGLGDGFWVKNGDIDANSFSFSAVPDICHKPFSFNGQVETKDSIGLIIVNNEPKTGGFSVSGNMEHGYDFNNGGYIVSRFSGSFSSCLAEPKQDPGK